MGGYFISFEGIEGAGKSTAIQTASAWLREQGHDVLNLREPGGTALGESLRDLLLQKHSAPVDAHTELLMMFASRAQLVAQVIRPALAEGKTVVCDRFTDASFAYQAGGRGLAWEKVAQLEQDFVGIKPDLTLLLDVSVSEGRARSQARSEPDRIESENNAFFERARAAYLKRAEQQPERFRLIDASQDQANVAQAVLQVLAEAPISRTAHRS